ncbi:MAG: hypothetical protein LH472_14920 [Pyrinomonadaceae bacterium]|nr:hypothetical protein [Pyrinomonadaceae bacterium]
MSENRNILAKLKSNLPWLVRYPFNRAQTFLEKDSNQKKHIIFTIANHFEPAWKTGGGHDLDTQRRRLDEYHKLARKTGEVVIDADGTKFRHTNFYPAEQYDFQILEQMAAMQSEGLGEVEIHLHHGVEKPDTAENLRKSLTEFRDCLAEEHACLSRFDGKGEPKYAFVHGNLALGNSANGKYCGVDNEIQILQETGCYADFTLPSAPDETQIPVINQIYECALPLTEKMPHRKGVEVAVFGKQPQLPLIFTGPLVFNWTRRIKKLPVPRIEDGALADNQPSDLSRFNRWKSANITVKNRPEWIFVKLYCHGFFDADQSACIGEKARQFFSEIIENGEKTGDYAVHFASAREAFNIVSAAIDGKTGTPHEFRNYRLQTIMSETKHHAQTQEQATIY